jgi:hypothetical protein
MLLVLTQCSLWRAGGEEPLAEASWAVPSNETVKQQFDNWLTSQEVADAQRQAIQQHWEATLHSELLLRHVLHAVAEVNAEAKTLLAHCEQPPVADLTEVLKSLSQVKQTPWISANLRLYFGAWLARHERYDEAAEQLHALQPADVIDPASLLFYQAVTAHRLLKKEECLPLIKRLLENKAALPARFVTVARLMQQDIEPLETDSLDEVARLMDDVRRRLELGRAGQKVREQEQAIIAKLDKKINELEQKKKQQQQQQQANQAKNQSPASPAEQSKVAKDIHATDETDPKKFTKKDNWGNLPPKQRQQALQQIGRDLPSHFRDTIEEYFKRLAQDGNE